MMIQVSHHISDELLLDYASGNLSEGWSIAVATHLALSPASRGRLKLMEHMGGGFLEACEAEPASTETSTDESWAQMKARLSNPASVPSQTVVASPAAASPVLPEPLRSYLGGDVDKLKWRALGRGAYHIPVETADKDSQVRLLKIPAGKPVPEHSHGGRELTVVLKGAFSDGATVFRRGDIEEADETLTHQPVATPDEDCICLAVTDAPLKFKSLLVRLVQPVLGI
ncbi:ChrR family anti-sigma-E factor [Rhizobium sp. G187]|uniref:ChrR family anti-sigma-E factor n=1 Tax=Rhizobium sp. G187 TaxID=3451352 RepID=UPI003EE63D60